MAGKVIGSPRAANDLEQICLHISRDSERYAVTFAQRVVDAVEQTAVMPEIGRVVPEFSDPGLRERIVGSYRIVYRLRPSAIEVVTVTHGARSRVL